MKQLHITFLLTVLMSMVGAKAFAHDIAVANDDGVMIYYNYTNGQSELEVTYQGSSYSTYSNEYSGKLIIPEDVTYNGITRKVTSIGASAFRSCSAMVSVVIPNSVTAIGSYAFYGCSLKSLIIGPGVLTIGSNQSSPIKVIWLTNTPPSNYSNLSGTKNYVANDQYTSLNGKTVYPFLSSIFVVDGIRYVPVSPSDRTCDAIDCIYDTSAEDIHIESTIVNQGVLLSVRTINGYTCYQNPYIKDVEISINGVVGNYAFSGCSSINRVVLSNNNYIAINAFENITSQFTASINNTGVIGSKAFYNSTGLKSLEIGPNVTNINSEAFSGCSGLNSAIINNHGVLNEKAFYNCTSMQTALIGEQVTSIDSYTFGNCSMLQTITIPNAVSSLGTYAFYNCSAMQSVRMGLGVRTVSERAFSGCSALSDMQIGDSVSVIGSYAFANCSSLPIIRIPQSVYSINNYAFSGCTSLRDVYMDDKTTEENDINLGNWTSTNTADGSMSSNTYTFAYNPGNVLSFDYWVSSESGYDKLIVTLDGSTIVTQSGEQSGSYSKTFTSEGTSTLIVKYTKDGSGSNGSDQARVSNIFLKHVGSLFLSSNGSSPLFVSCPLDSVYIGRNINYNTLSSNGYSPFYRNTSLRSVVITDKETEISENEFYGCTNLKNVRIGDGVETIGNWAFSGCSSLDYFAFGTALKSIGKEAFSDCTAVTNIISKAATPPTCESQALDDINKWTCTLQVPVGGIDAYKAASQWKEFFFIVEDDVSNQWFKLIYKVDGETYKSYDLRYGAAISPEAPPTKEGYTFSGWTTIPETMPASDVTIVGSFSVNSYTLTYELDGETYKSYEIPFGTIITPEAAPSRDGYTFTGWSEIPTTMPAHDIVISGSLVKNTMADGDRIEAPDENGIIIHYVFINNGTELAVTYSGETYNADLNEYTETIVIPENVNYEGETYRVTAIDENAFRLCTNLTNVSIPSTICNIGISAFSGCTALQTITSATTTPPACGSQAFEGVDKNNCKIYIPDGTSISYKMADGWKDFALFYSDDEGFGDPDSNTLAINNIVYDKTGDAILPILLNNADQITGLQIDLYLPEGVTVATNSRGKMTIETTERMDGNYTISSNTMDGYVRILGYSADGDAFTGNSGDILNVTLNIDENMADGDYTVRLKDIVLSDVNNTEYHPADVGATLTVKSYVLGDVDNSGAININDVVCIINHILGKTVNNFIAEAADVDGSGAVNINDVVTIINRYILMKTSAPSMFAENVSRRAASVDENYLHLDDITINPGETKEVKMLMTNTGLVAAIQGKLMLPAGLSIVKKSNGRVDAQNINARSEDFTLSTNVLDDGSLTFAQYSADGFTYEGNEGGIFTFKIKADENATAGTYSLTLSNVVLSIDGVGYDIPDRMSSLTVTGTSGISNVNVNDNDNRYYTLDGQQLQGKPTQKGVYIHNGKKVVMK